MVPTRLLAMRQSLAGEPQTFDCASRDATARDFAQDDTLGGTPGLCGDPEEMRGSSTTWLRTSLGMTHFG